MGEVIDIKDRTKMSYVPVESEIPNKLAGVAMALRLYREQAEREDNKAHINIAKNVFDVLQLQVSIERNNDRAAYYESLLKELPCDVEPHDDGPECA